MNQSGEQNATGKSMVATLSSAETTNASTTTTEATPELNSATTACSTSSAAGDHAPVTTGTASETTKASTTTMTTTTAKRIVPVLKRKRDASPESNGNGNGEGRELAVKRSKADDGSSENGGSKKKKKRVVFDGVTVFFFRRTQGFTSVPSQGGSTLGMTNRHEQISKFSLKQFAQSQDRTHRAILRKQLMDRRCQQLKEASPCSTLKLREAESDLDEELDNININDYYFLQPIPTKQRRLLLRRAGVKKIDNTEKMELKEIRHSRESCGCDCQMVCNPETCMCSLAGIKCQVDRQSFPCGCTKEGCQNNYGRIEFNPSRVRTHFIHTIMRLDMEHRQDEIQNPTGEGVQEKTEGPPDVSSLTSPLEDWVHQPSTSTSSMYSGSLNGRDYYGNGEHPGLDDSNCSSSLYPKSCESYGSGNSLEENIPVEVHTPRQHDLIPQMLQFNESEDESALTQPIAPLCNVPLPTMPCYDSSEDNLSSASDTSSSSEASSNYELNETCTPFDFKPSADYNLASSLVQSPEVNSLSHSPTVEGSLPQLTPLEVSNVFSRRQADNETDSKIYTELKQPDSYASGSFTSGLYNHENSAHSSYNDMFMTYESSKVAESLPLPLPSLTPNPLAYTTCNSPTTSSTYTVMSSLNVVDSLSEMQETAIATSKLCSVTFGMKDDPSTGYVQPEPLLFPGESASASATTTPSSSTITTSCKDAPSSVEMTGNEAAPARRQENPSDAIISSVGSHDEMDSAEPETPLVCSSTEVSQMISVSEASAGEKESADTCSVASSPRDISPQEDTSNQDNRCCSSAEAQGRVDSHCDRTGSISLEKTTSSVEAHPEPDVNNSESTHAPNEPITSSDGSNKLQPETFPSNGPVEASITNGSVGRADKRTVTPSNAAIPSLPLSATNAKVSPHPPSATNAKVSALPNLPKKALADTPADIANKMQVLRSNSEGDATPSISPDSLSPDGVLSDDPFKQVIDASAMDDESSFSSSDSAVGHMTNVGGHMTFSEISAGLPFVEAGLSE